MIPFRHRLFKWRNIVLSYIILCDICQNIVWTYIAEEIYRKHNNKQYVTLIFIFFTVHFISIKHVLSDHLPYVTIFHCSFGRSHKTDLNVYLIVIFSPCVGPLDTLPEKNPRLNIIFIVTGRMTLIDFIIIDLTKKYFYCW